MRGVETRIQEIRHRVFREVARMAYHTEWPVDKRIESLPYKIIPGEVGNFRNDVFLERAIVGERLRSTPRSRRISRRPTGRRPTTPLRSSTSLSLPATAARRSGCW